MADRVFIFHDTTNNFRAFQFDGTAVTAENWSPGFGTIGGATADYAHIYVLDTSVGPPIVRVFNASQVRQSTMDITMNSGDTYSGIAVTDTHLVAINQTAGKLEYYDLATKAYDASMDAALPTLTSPGVYSGICRSGNFLYLTSHNDSTYAPQIYKRNLDGSAVSDWAGQTSTTALTIFATRDRVNIVRKNGGHWDRFAFDGTADTLINTIGGGLWAGSYTTFDLATAAITSSYDGNNNQFQVNVNWTGGHGDFTQADVSLSHGRIVSFTNVSGSNYQIRIAPPATGMGTLVLTIRKDAVTEKNAEITFTVGTFDNTGPPPPVTTPGMQENVRVTFPTATSALLQWDRPSSGIIDVDTYEVSVAAGSSPGTNYVATGSTRTRHLITGLQRGTQYTFAVRGRNADGAGAASSPVTETTPIASLHNALFFKECVNYLDNGERVSERGNPRNIIRAAADNDYNTWTAEKDLDINIAVNGNPTRVDAIFVKGQDIEAHSATPTGGAGSGYSNRRMPEAVENWEGTEISTSVNGFQHDLYLLDTHFTATSVRMRFTGTTAKIYEVMLLEFLLEIDANGDFTEINPDYVDRSAVIHQSPDGGVRRSSPLGAERPKWETTYVVKIVPGKTLLASVDEFVTQMGENPNVVHAQEPSRYPARIHPASFLLTRVPTRLRGDNKLLGDVVNFRVGEQ